MALRAAIEYLWKNPEEAEVMGMAAKVRFQKYFTSDKMVKSYVHLYSKLLDKKIISFKYNENSCNRS
jgi:hypothetical protein